MSSSVNVFPGIVGGGEGFQVGEQKPVSYFHRDSSKNSGIELQQIRHKITDSGANAQVSRFPVPEYPGKCYVKSRRWAVPYYKGRVYINIKKGRAYLLAQYQNKECCKYFCKGFFSVSTVAAFVYNECWICLLFHEITSDGCRWTHRNFNAETNIGLSMAHVFYV